MHGIAILNPDLLANIAVRPFQSDFTFADVPATYFGTAIPLIGTVTVTANRERLEAEIVNRDGWEARMLRALRPRAGIPMGGLFRTVAPNVLLGPNAHGSIQPDDCSWAALQATYTGQSSSYGHGDDHEAFRFSVTELLVPGPAVGHAVAATRHIYAGGDWNGAAEFQGRLLIIRSLVDRPPDRDHETMSATIGWCAEGIVAEAMWLTLSFITGNGLKHLAEEFYDAEGALIRTVHHLGNSIRDVRRRFFHGFHGPLGPNGIGVIADGIVRLMQVRFPIEVILEHLHESAGRSIDVEAQHLVLAIHTAIEAWNRQFGVEEWIDKNIWETLARNLRKNLIPNDVYDDIGEEMKANIRDDLAHSNRTTTAWRESELFRCLSIALTDDDRRALKLRNELLHNGYFLRRWDDLTLVERQQRHLDVERLRRLVLLTVFRLTAYNGQYMSPITYAAETVEPIALPDAIAPPR